MCIVWNVCALSNVSNVSSIAPKPRACAQAQPATQTTPSTTSAGGRACSARNGPNAVSNARPEMVGPGVVFDHGGGGPGNGGPLETGHGAALKRGQAGPNAPGNAGAGAGHTGRAGLWVGPSRPSHHERATAGLARPQAERFTGQEQAGPGADRLAAPHSAPPGHAPHRRPACGRAGPGWFWARIFFFFLRGPDRIRSRDNFS